MFWGLILRANKRYSQTVTKTFHLSQATLDVAQHTGDNDVQVSLTSDSENYILCTLSKKKNVLQVPLDLVFSEGDEISFSSNGVVHLTGYLIPNDEFDGFGGDEEELDEEEQEEEVPAKQLTKKELSLKKLMEEQLADEDDSDSDFGEEAGEGEEEEDDDDEEAEEEEDDDDDDDDDEAESDEEEIVEPAPKKQKQANGLANGKPEQQKPVQPEQPKEKQLQGGVKVEDIRVGKGPEAKPGKKVQVYYEGRLKSNNKIFDSSKSGKGFSFNLGRGEVIRGWDLGVAGMKVGSKRRITCPPAMAYGAKGSPPVIPANATLVFDVELRGVK